VLDALLWGMIFGSVQVAGCRRVDTWGVEMAGGQRSRRLGLVAGAAAVVLAGAGGAAAGLGAPGWLAGAVAAVSALVAGVVADRVYAAREGREAARERRGLVLDALRDARPPTRGEELGLLLADRCPVPFRGRSRELARLAAWREGEPGCPVMLVAGPAGVGKSRLALEFASRLPAGWAAGWLHAGAGAVAVDAVRGCGDPAVILADDADGRSDLVPLLGALAERREDPAVRVVLVTRSASGLRATLAEQLEERHAWVVLGAMELDLGTEGGLDDQVRWFGEAVVAFAAALGKTPPVLPERFPVGGMAAEAFVMLQGQALLAVLDQGQCSGDPRDLPLDELMAALMGHERRRWRAVAASWDWGSGRAPSAEVQARAVAALALLGADSNAEAAEIVRQVPELRDAPAERLAAVVSWAAGLYPGGPGVAPRIRPDLVGEWFVVSELAADQDLARSLRAGISDEQAARALAFLARAADWLEAASGLFKEFGSGDLRRLILAAVLAARTGEAARGLLDPVIAAQIAAASDWTLDQLTGLQDTVPGYMLLRTHVTIGQLIVTVLRAMAADNPAAHQDDLAAALSNLGVRLDRVGRYEEALEATQEAVALRRVLAADNPAAHQDDLAIALDHLGIQLHEVGRYEEALEATQEAVALNRVLAADNPAAHQEGLAIALYNLGIRLGRVGRYEEALEATQESVALNRVLAADNPAAHQDDLANALHNLGNRLGEVGRYEEALEAAQESVALNRVLAADNPAAHQANLADGLSNLGVDLDRVGRSAEALAARTESVRLYRNLALADPDLYRDEYRRRLTALRKEFDQKGLQYEAIMHDLADPG
jgi:tetratricopeptide (TPR) repeat protein